MQKPRNRFDSVKTAGQVFDIFLDFAKGYPAPVLALGLFREYVDVIRDKQNCSWDQANNIARKNIADFTKRRDENVQRLMYTVYKQALGR